MSLLYTVDASSYDTDGIKKRHQYIQMITSLNSYCLVMGGSQNWYCNTVFPRIIPRGINKLKQPTDLGINRGRELFEARE